MSAKKAQKKDISIVVPVYNEFSNIVQLIERLEESLLATNLTYEIVIVDDHSDDGTWEYLQRYGRSERIRVFEKKGKKGKAYSLIEGFLRSRGEMIGMIDADLQYPPEAIVGMVKKISEGADVVVANRKSYRDSLLRKVANKGFRFLFGRALFGLSFDVQSGLKLFRRRVFETVRFSPFSSWTFDLEFLHRASEAGFKILDFDIEFYPRRRGKSKINFAKSVFEIGAQALLLRMRKIHPQHIPSLYLTSMRGAGVGYRKNKYITHTTLPHHISAIRTLDGKQKVFTVFILGALIFGFYKSPLLASQIIIATFSFIYFVDVLFNLFLVIKSLSFPCEIVISHEEFRNLDDEKLPSYTILCPLYREGHIVPQFVKAIKGLDYPKDKLDVLLLLEEDDKKTIDSVSGLTLPSYIRTIIVPHSIPKTKPKACNYGLSFAKGEYLVVYDAEDIPDPLQLKKAYLAFGKVDSSTICLQAKLNYYNTNQNLLTRFFTAEYSLWFDITLTGLQSVGTAIPLGGTSNHFRTNDLKKLFGWDPFNVTEDADLGIRLFKKGFKTAIIDSVTYEEANSSLLNWIRQRSRWIKGYMQTYLVHVRSLSDFAKTSLHHSLFFQLIIGGKLAFILINPFLWIATISYFLAYQVVGPTIESLYPSGVFYLAAFSLVFGNFLFLYYYMIGCAKRGQWELIKYIFFTPLYWLAISFAGFIALYQLLFKPHFWEKTVHGLHLGFSAKDEKSALEFAKNIPVETQVGWDLPNPFRKRLGGEAFSNVISGGFLLMAMVFANFVNFVFNAYLGRKLSFEDFGLVSLISSFLYFAFIPLGALSSSVAFRSGFLEGRYGVGASYHFWKNTRGFVFIFSLMAASLWILFSSTLKSYFHVSDIYPFVIFCLVWIVGFVGACDRGYLSGKVLFGFLGILLVFESVIRLSLAYILTEFGFGSYSYISIPISVLASFMLGYVTVSSLDAKSSVHESASSHFPFKFFSASLLSTISTILFLTLDVILAKHFLSPTLAGQYALVSLVGKMIYFLGSLTIQFITPLAARSEGENKSSWKTFYFILSSTAALSFLGLISFGFFGGITVPYLFGEKAYEIIPYLIPAGLGMMCFSISRVFVTYYLTKNIYSFTVVSFLLSIFQIGVISFYHQNVSSIVLSMLLIGELNLFLVIILHLLRFQVKIFENAVRDFLSVFSTYDKDTSSTRLRILIYNWRDIHHKWAGGAEVYVHELAKRWVKDGNEVTIFCGNDNLHARDTAIDSVTIIRRGGFYMVYFWAFIYYIFRFRGKFDVVIDCENGIPFFTPLYVRKPIILLIHHIHQEVFRNHLIFPFSFIAMFAEEIVMPFLYKGKSIITVSESSKKEILRIGLGSDKSIEVVNPGVEESMFAKKKKVDFPLFVYVGRLMPYKNIDIVIRAFSQIVTVFSDARLIIVGYGEMLPSLKKLAIHLGIYDKVEFLGRVSDQKKAQLLATSWVVLQPSQVEGWGITVIEANASGTPVIASNVNGLKDSVINQETGILVQVKSVDEFVRAMINVLVDEKYRNTLSKNAYLWSKNFSWDKSALRFYSLILRQIDMRVKLAPFGKVLYAKANDA